MEDDVSAGRGGAMATQNGKNDGQKQIKKNSAQFNLVQSTTKEASVPKIAHEFRTRLSIMRGAIENVVDGIFGPMSKEQDRQLRLALESVERMSELVEDLMASFSDREGRMRLNIMEVPLQSVVSRVLDSMHSDAFKEGIALMAEMQGEPILVKCDPSKIEQVMINLLRNSIKFTSRGGSIIVKAMDMGDMAAVSVMDTGVGIPKEKLKKICNQAGDIRDLKDANGGFRSSGLGLIIVREIIEAHNGELTITSEIGSGTTFTFTLQKT